MLLTGAVLAIALALAAGAPAPERFGEDSRHAPRQCVALQVVSPQLPKPRPHPVFSATQILDIEFRTFLRRRLEGLHTLELKLYTPKGNLYQVLTVPFTAPQTTPVRLDGARRQQVDATLPVAGTSIMTNSLYGEWKVEPFLDGSAEPCGQARVFVIRQ